jgi:hypothetical protein
MGVEHIGKAISEHKVVPLDLFSQREVGLLESLVEYLKEERNMTYHEIALLLNRDDRTIWTTYKQVKRKRGKA